MSFQIAGNTDAIVELTAGHRLEIVPNVKIDASAHARRQPWRAYATLHVWRKYEAQRE
ncbi:MULTISPECIES: hypothetical protein [unclassified Paraburkholderia]|uniref:hypothetical protein n=1 Tax=unclassified Paraburkholderia TaxID=2615204 RepID=UPI0015E5A6DF|nr:MULTISPECIES: hypothetical protein [unclassified Paraburkholderia]